MERNKRPRRPAPSTVEQLPPHLQESPDVMESMDPTAVGLGNSSDVTDCAQFVDIQRLDILVRDDLTRWSAIDEILWSLAASVPGISNIQARERAQAAKNALYGTASGPVGVDDSQQLRDLALAYVRDRILHDSHTREAQNGAGNEGADNSPSLFGLIKSVIDPSTWESWNQAQREAHYRRIKGKFEKDREKLLVEATASFHPEQQSRWRKVQAVISLLKELGLAP